MRLGWDDDDAELLLELLDDPHAAAAKATTRATPMVPSVRRRVTFAVMRIFGLYCALPAGERGSRYTKELGASSSPTWYRGSYAMKSE